MHTNATTSPRQPLRQGRSGPLWWFVALSICLHLWLLWSWQGTEQVGATAPLPTIGVRLTDERVSPRTPHPNHTAAATVPTPPRQATPVARQKPQPSPREAVREAKTVAPTQAAPPEAEAPVVATKDAPTVQQTEQAARATPPKAGAKTEVKTTGPDTATTPAHETAQASALARERAETHIRLELARHFDYPLLARKRGWQGEVLLAFHLAADGRIRDARIARSSGHGVLDRAALKALDKVAPLEHRSPGGFTLQIPVIYRLEG